MTDTGKNTPSNIIASSINSLIQTKIELFQQQKSFGFTEVVKSLTNNYTLLCNIDNNSPEKEVSQLLTQTKQSWKAYIEYTEKYLEYGDRYRPSEMASLLHKVLGRFKFVDPRKKEFIELYKKQNPNLSEIQLNAKYEKAKLKIKEVEKLQNKTKS